jgi:NADH-quinone oxidoreductase subunit C
MEFSQIIEVIKLRTKTEIEVLENTQIVKVNAEHWLHTAEVLKNDPDLTFDNLLCISSYDTLDNQTYGVAYNFHSYSKLHYCEVRIEVSDNVEIPSVANIWRTADWHEREAYDLMGVKFSNHPDLKRILLPDDWEGHPLRKNYQVAEKYNGITIVKDKTYWK